MHVEGGSSPRTVGVEVDFEGFHCDRVLLWIANLQLFISVVDAYM
jgi:hypothetical protein